MLVLSGANIAAAYRLISDLLSGEGLQDAGDLILTGGAIWLTNVIIFAFWYWMFDRGGPVARAVSPRPYPDFLFPQMTDERVVMPGWRPEFFDYLYTSFTNATAFSPTDTMPMSRWAKLTMMLQSIVALLLAILVIACGQRVEVGFEPNIEPVDRAAGSSSTSKGGDTDMASNDRSVSLRAYG